MSVPDTGISTLGGRYITGLHYPWKSPEFVSSWLKSIIFPNIQCISFFHFFGGRVGGGQGLNKIPHASLEVTL